MVCLRVVENPGTVQHPAGFRVFRAEDQPVDAGGGDGGGAHRTGLQGDPDGVAGQTLRPGGCACGADRQQFGMAGGVVIRAGAVASTRDDPARGIRDDRADGDLAAICRRARLCQCDLHLRGKCAHDPSLPCPALLDKGFRGGIRRTMADTPPPGDRIAKVLARAGVASRREAERMIADRRVAVNGKTIDSPALNVTARDQIAVDGKPLAEPDAPRLWLYHKPAGLVTTERDEQGRDTVFAALPKELGRVISVGRLDIASEGLLLLTNDGSVKRRLELPSTGWLRRYRVRVKGAPDAAQVQPLRDGIEVEGMRYQPMEVTIDRQQGANAWLTVAIREGKNREVRRAMAAIGLSVNRLIRVSYGPFQLGKLKAGEVSEVKGRVLRDQLGLKADPPKAGNGIRRKPTSKTVLRSRSGRRS